MAMYGYLAISCVLHIHIPLPGQIQSCFTPHDANGRPMKKRHGRDSSGQDVLQVLVYPLYIYSYKVMLNDTQTFFEWFGWGKFLDEHIY